MINIKKKKRNSIVVVLFINHKPVSQPIIWEEWKEINKVEYKVVCPFTIRINCFFSKRYQLDFYMNENTHWGSFSYCFYLIESIKKILEIYKGIDNGMIYIVSGDDIPLYNLHPINFNYNEFEMKESGLIGNFSGFCFKKLKEIDFKTKTYIGFLKYYNGLKNISGFQPPEFYWYDYFYGKREEEDKCDRLNLQFHRFEYIKDRPSYSPIEWYLLKDQFEYVQDIQFFDKNSKRTIYAITNLRKLLLFMRKETNNSRTLFFRKVMSSCDTSQLLSLLQDCFWKTSFFFKNYFNCNLITLSETKPIPWPFVDGNKIFLFEYKRIDFKDKINTLKNHNILKENSNDICMDVLLPYLRSNKTSYEPTDILDIYFYLKSSVQNHKKVLNIIKKLKTIQTMINKEEIKEENIKQTHGIQTLLIETTTEKNNTTNQ